MTPAGRMRAADFKAHRRRDVITLPAAVAAARPDTYELLWQPRLAVRVENSLHGKASPTKRLHRDI